MNKIILKIDASSIKKSACLLAVYRTVIEGYRSVKTSNVIEYGSAFHLFEKTLYQSKADFAEHLAIAEAQKYFKNLQASGDMEIADKKGWMSVEHLTKTCLKYVDEFGAKGEKDSFQRLTGPDGNLLVEQTFSIPWYVNDNIEVLLQGTIDKIGKFKNGPYAIGDTKTTNSWDIDDFFVGFYMKPQLKFYKLAIEWLAEHFPDSIFGEMLRKGGRIGCFIDGVFLSYNKDTIFKRSPVMYFSAQEMQEFHQLLDYKIKQLVIHVSSQMPPLKEGMLNEACEGNWGHRCPFFASCSAPDEISTEAILNSSFNQIPYDPLTHGKSTN